MRDVAVIGGGPAGCAAAITLANAGRSVVLLERGSGEREGFCGEFLSPDGVGSLDLLGALDRVLAFEPPPVSTWRVSGARRDLAGRLPAPAIGISRRALDPSLRAVAVDAGVEVLEGAHVRTVETTGDGAFEIVTADARYLTRRVVGAVGRTARVPGLTSPPTSGSREFVAFKAHFRGPASSEIRLFPLHGAYVGVGPVNGDRINVCYLARRSAFEAAGSEPSALLERATHGHPAWGRCWGELERLSERWLSTGGLFFRPRPIDARRGLVLCGDAAGLISPFLGEGMSMALESGVLAGSLLHRFFDAPEDLAERYPALWTRRFGRRMKWGERLQRTLLSPRADAAMRWVALVPWLADRVVRSSRSADLVAHGAAALERCEYSPASA